MTLRVVIPPHPIIGHWLSVLRNPETPPPIYETGLQQISKWVTYEALRDWMPHRKEKIRTSHCETEGILIESGVELLCMVNMPGGLHLWLGAKEIIPNGSLCVEEIPDNIEKTTGVIIFTDQITTGERLLNTLKSLRNKGVNSKRVRIVTVLASNQGLKRIGETIPDLTIYGACIDPEIVNKDECMPGIGNPKLRLKTRFKVRD